MDNNDYIRAKALIDTHKKWCKKYGAVDANGNPVIADEGAAKMCAVGACYAICRSDLCKQLHQIARKLGYVNAMDLNDQTSHEMVMDMFDVAIGTAFLAGHCIFQVGDIIERWTPERHWGYWTTIHTQAEADAAVLLDKIWFRVRRYSPRVQVRWLS